MTTKKKTKTKKKTAPRPIKKESMYFIARMYGKNSVYGGPQLEEGPYNTRAQARRDFKKYYNESCFTIARVTTEYFREHKRGAA